MSLTTLIDSVLGKQKKRQEARAADFRDIVVQIADGREPDADFVAQVLHEAGKSLDDLQKAVELLQRRRELRRQLDSIPQLAAERQEVERQLLAADAELEAAEERHANATAPLRLRLGQLGEAISSANATKYELARTCNDEKLLAKLSAVVEKLNAVRREAGVHHEAARTARERANAERNAAERAKSIWRGEDEVRACLSRAAEHDRVEAECKTAAAKVEKVIAALEREEAAIREQMLVP